MGLTRNLAGSGAILSHALLLLHIEALVQSGKALAWRGVPVPCGVLGRPGPCAWIVPCSSQTGLAPCLRASL